MNTPYNFLCVFVKQHYMSNHSFPANL